MSNCVLFYDSFKNGKVVIMLAGRFAGRKAVIIKATDEGTGDKRFGHAVGNFTDWSVVSLFLLTVIWILCFYEVAGIDRYPRKVVKAMGKAKIEKRSKIQPFLKAVNYNHIMPTR